MKHAAIALLLIAIMIACYVIYGTLTGSKGISAICNDGTASMSVNRSGTCSRHGGVARWTKED